MEKSMLGIEIKKKRLESRLDMIEIIKQQNQMWARYCKKFR